MAVAIARPSTPEPIRRTRNVTASGIGLPAIAEWILVPTLAATNINRQYSRIRQSINLPRGRISISEAAIAYLPLHSLAAAPARERRGGNWESLPIPCQIRLGSPARSAQKSLSLLASVAKHPANGRPKQLSVTPPANHTAAVHCLPGTEIPVMDQINTRVPGGVRIPSPTSRNPSNHTLLYPQEPRAGRRRLVYPKDR